MKTTRFAGLCMAFLLCLTPIHAASAQDAPQFMKETFPEQGVEAAWKEFQTIMGPETALAPKTKELIALGVAAQIPCDYCVYYHTQAAKKHGASQEEVQAALASSALVRKWSTMLNGSQYDEAAWKQQVDAMFAGQ